MMYPIKGLFSWTGVACPLGTPLARGFSGVEGQGTTLLLGMPLGIRPPGFPPPMCPLAAGTPLGNDVLSANAST